LADHRVLKPTDGFPLVTNTEIVLVIAADASPATPGLAEVLAEYCSSTDPITTSADCRDRTSRI
jgi:hypothetical protein